MLSKAARRILVFSGVLVVVGVLALVSRSVTLSPWLWTTFLAGAGLGALGSYLADRSDWLMLLIAYVLWAIAGLVALVPPGVLREEAIASYVLLAVALPFLAVFIRERARWWALIPAYPLLTIVGAIGLVAAGLFTDDLVAAYVTCAFALPFLVVGARDRKLWWVLILGAALIVLGVSFATWLPWHAVRGALIACGAIGDPAAIGLVH
jgi:hypothetical protein